MNEPWRRFLPDPMATEQLGAELAAQLRPGDLVLLRGPLGAGKTTLVRGLVRALGGDPAEVCSPTFILRETYALGGVHGIRALHHLDLYRLRGRPQSPWLELGLGELLDDPGAITAVEWPEDLPPTGLAPRVLHLLLQWEGDGRAVEGHWETEPGLGPPSSV
ncbi:MAG: tRNA (adenosine(37)-N6)-threonylcarbamoyltransferase complex ATPase subunit type 1 TsaE [Thermoanaerobaculum sp.]|nr:tRNA (adenosine(37)-N6)-threonylcarbamoyltransferase complex ATPase subunit type 1 TsaE [Thermoanaerobaculum sp.]MDW7967733.1 tRNA (adenosine(37)-N6)-threonylcarbamoyltransferase complex ATPase subunit type 1 TsaE [Thermoanaerobaculum sp.]